MKTLHITVSDKIATYQQRDGDIVCGNNDYQIKFTFDSEWYAYEQKTARFIYGNQHSDVVFTGDTCAVPMMQGVDSLTVGVFVSNSLTSTPATIVCVKSILCENVTSAQ